jgi:hypothetical protein
MKYNDIFNIYLKHILNIFKYMFIMNDKHCIYIEVNYKLYLFLNKLHPIFLDTLWNKMELTSSSFVTKVQTFEMFLVAILDIQKNKKVTKLSHLKELW